MKDVNFGISELENDQTNHHADVHKFMKTRQPELAVLTSYTCFIP